VFEGLKWLLVGCMKLDERKYDEAEFGEVPLSENKKAVEVVVDDIQKHNRTNI
jgi:hypothetical protein